MLADSVCFGLVMRTARSARATLGLFSRHACCTRSFMQNLCRRTHEPTPLITKPRREKPGLFFPRERVSQEFSRWAPRASGPHLEIPNNNDEDEEDEDEHEKDKREPALIREPDEDE
jgi:hypothetical protein